MSLIPPPAREPIAGSDGIVTRTWWRFFQALMVVTGGNTGAPPVTTVPQLAARIASLETSVDLLLKVMSDQPYHRDDLNAIRRDLDATLAYSLSVH